MKRLFQKKYIIPFVLSLIVITTLQNCERDDICAATTSTTPRLVIEFYDIDNPESLKNVPRLTVYGEGQILNEDGQIIEPIEASDKIIEDYVNESSYVFNVNTNKIGLPLKIDDGLNNETITTRYILEKDTNQRIDATGESNTDILEITYKTEFVYVSRACGYKSIFTELSVTRDTDSEPWIANIEIEETIELTVENENTTHVRIYH
ncbi:MULTISPECIES: DUF6452 family protein [Winogradskyella]|uniref:DUF6452 family protein n=1 Tax=Winogradskyella damuponensis TaxID=943939 RepID=A0ABP8CWS1_9FLAO